MGFEENRHHKSSELSGSYERDDLYVKKSRKKSNRKYL